MEIRKVYMKTRAEFGKQCIFDLSGPTLDVDIEPNLAYTTGYVLKSYCNVGVQHSTQLALHEVQTTGKTMRNSGMFHLEGGWPKEVNPRDEEATARFRRRTEKDDDWAPKLHNLFEIMEPSILQNGTINIYQHYFDDIILTKLVQPVYVRTVNVYADPETPKRPVTNISWSPDSGSRIVVSYCFLKFGRQPDYSNRVYIWQVDNPNEPYMALEPFSPCVVCEFNPRDPSVLASGLMTGQVCNWDIRTGTTPVQSSHLQFSHRGYVNAVKWLASKSNTEFFSTSSDGRAMWWDTRWIREPMEILMFDLETPNEPDMDRVIGVSCLNFGPTAGTKFMLGMDNGVIISVSKRAKTNAEKLAVRFEAHYGPVAAVDRNPFNPGLFLSIGDWTARIWSEDTREGNLVSTLFLKECPTAGCWNKSRQSVFYVATDTGTLLAWDLLQSIRQPISTLQLCKEPLTAIAPYEEGTFMAIGNSGGEVFLVESSDFLQSFNRKDRNVFSEYIERCSKLTKAVDVRLREIKLAQKILAKEEAAMKAKERLKSKRKTMSNVKQGEHTPTQSVSSKEKRKSGQKEVIKNPREDIPAYLLHETEQRYFEIIEQEFEKYAVQGDPDVCPNRPQHSSTRKHERRQKKKSQQEDVETKSFKKKSAKKTSTRVLEFRKKKELSKRPKSSLDVTAAASQLASEPSSARSKSRTVMEKTAKGKKKKQKITFVLPVPCKGKICRPKVCCFRTHRKKKAIIEKPGAGRLSSMHAFGVSLGKLMDDSKKSIRRSSIRFKQASSIWKTLDMPLELTQEVERARRESKEITLLKGKLGRFIAESISKKSRTKPGSERSLRNFEDDYDEKSVDEDTGVDKTIEDTGQTKKTITPDPCVPPKGKSIAEEFSAMLGVPMPTSIEEPVEGRARTKKLEAARKRVYSRISRFQSIE